MNVYVFLHVLHLSDDVCAFASPKFYKPRMPILAFRISPFGWHVI